MPRASYAGSPLRRCDAVCQRRLITPPPPVRAAGRREMRAHVARAPRPAQPRHPIPSTAANTGPIAPIFACTPERPVHVVSCARLELQFGSVDGKPGATGMALNAPLRTSQRIVQICLFLFAAIGLFGGTLQVYLVQ